MLRSLVLLIVTLAAFALAAPAPKPAFKPLEALSSLRNGLKSFKSLSSGHRGNRDPRTELSRVYNKFNWAITASYNGQDYTISWPPPAPYSDGESSSVDPSDPATSDSAPPASYGSGTSDSSDSSDSTADAESSSATAPSYGDQPSYGAPSSYTTEPAASPETSAAAAASDAVAYSYATEFSAGFSTGFSTRVSASASASGSASAASATVYASATASASPYSESDGEGDGEVQAHPEENESEYLSPVTIGGQELNLNFDTGSADLWVFSTALSSSERGDHAAFDSSKSDTWEEYEGASWDISYGDGSGASGTVGFDQVDVGGITATRQAVEIATAVSSAFVSDENNDGLLGLAFGVINTIQPKSQQTFFESVADQLEEKAFTADLDVDAAGTYEFGRIDTEKYQGELHTTKIDNSRGFWEFTSNVYSIGGKDVSNPSASTAIADTGTSLMMVDDDIAEAYYAQIEGSSMDRSAGGYVYPCDADIPSFGVAIGDNGFIAHLNGSDIEYARISQNTCFGGVQGNQGQGIQIYGAVLLKQYFAVFNFGDLTFGLAQKN